MEVLPGPNSIQPVGSDVDVYEFATDINDAYRRARLNAKYYGYLLARLQARNRWLEIAIALGTSGSVASLAAWNTAWGRALFGLLIGTATVLGVAKPFLNYTAAIAKYGKLWSGYNALFSRFEIIVREMRVYHGIRPDSIVPARQALEAVTGLANEEDPDPKSDLVERFQAEVEKEIPNDRLWWPSTVDASTALESTPITTAGDSRAGAVLAAAGASEMASSHGP